jgi:hypothetical protein
LSRHNLSLRITELTEHKIALRELLEKGFNTTFLLEMIGCAAERLMQLETEGFVAPQLASVARSGATIATGINTR